VAERAAARGQGRGLYRAGPHDARRGRGQVRLNPLSIPRFYIKKSEAAALQALALSRKAPTALVKARMTWEKGARPQLHRHHPGTDPKLGKQIIVVQGYYDSMSVVPALAPGAESAGSMAALLQTARTFKKYPPKRTMWFVATSGHYLGLQGVREYLNTKIDEWQVPGPFAKLFGQAKAPKQPIYLWAGLDMASQTKSLGIFYKGTVLRLPRRPAKLVQRYRPRRPRKQRQGRRGTRLRPQKGVQRRREPG
jgi:hypothetical protein